MQITSSAEDYHLALLLGTQQKGIKTCTQKECLFFKLNIVLVSAALCEAIINRFFAYKCDSESQFTKFDKASLLNKWEKAPKEFSSDYILPADVISNLKVLIEWRKNLVHSKPKIVKNEQTVLKGNQSVQPLTVELTKIFIQLPLDLGAELLKIDGSSSFFKGDYFSYKEAIESGIT